LKQSPTYQAAVVGLQCLLNQMNAAGLTVDGYFGASTKSAVIVWQRKNGLDTDGVVGCRTWNTLCNNNPTSSLLAQELVNLATKEIGVKEVPLYSNRGPRVDTYRAATWLALGNGWNWCAAFICWLMREAMAEDSFSFLRPQTAGAWDFERWAREQECGVSMKKPHNNDIKAGDIVVYTWQHIGLATSAPDTSGNINTIEGNTYVDGSADRRGVGVYAKKRKLSDIRSRIRITASTKCCLPQSDAFLASEVLQASIGHETGEQLSKLDE
jgi:hypothetical protein